MKHTSGKILKSDQVVIDGKFKLDFSQFNHCTSDSMNTTLKSPQVNIIENNEGFIVIQVICSCGKEINLKGEYNPQNKA